MEAGFKVREPNHPYFVTCSIVRWMPVFVSGKYLEILAEAFRYYQANRGLKLHAYIFMPTHFHFIGSTEAEDGLPTIVRDYKRYTARQIYRQCEADGNKLFCYVFDKAIPKGQESGFKVWQDEYHPEQVFTQPFFEQKVNYLHDNPVRKGLVSLPQNWLYSSAADYFGVRTGPLKIDWIEW